MTTARDLEEAAELATRLHLQETTVDRDGRTLTGRIRDHMAGHPRAASYDSDRVSGYTASDPTGEAAIRPDTAAADLNRFEDLARDVLRDVEAMDRIARRYSPRPATEKERRETAAGNETCCVSCARTESSQGIPRGEPVYKGRTINGEVHKLCRWCYQWASDTGALPPISKVEEAHSKSERYVRRSA